MPGYFDEDEPEPERPRRDREMTLGTGAIVGLVVGLVLLCGLCFVGGYAVGHHGSAPTAAANAPTAAPDQEPLQPNSSIPKPSASDQTAVPPPQTEDSPATPAEGDGANPTTTEQGPGDSGQGGSEPGAGGPGATTPGATQPVRPALPTAAPAVPGGAAPNVHTSLPAQAKLMVQIAAVANGEDADVLMTALRKRGYSVTATREPADGLIHVRIGPFNSRDEANRWRDKLLGDGYNAVVQP
jgi:cell division septation protein DedD